MQLSDCPTYDMQVLVFEAYGKKERRTKDLCGECFFFFHFLVHFCSVLYHPPPFPNNNNNNRPWTQKQQISTNDTYSSVGIKQLKLFGGGEECHYYFFFFFKSFIQAASQKPDPRPIKTNITFKSVYKTFHWFHHLVLNFVSCFLRCIADPPLP